MAWLACGAPPRANHAPRAACPVVDPAHLRNAGLSLRRSTWSLFRQANAYPPFEIALDDLLEMYGLTSRDTA